MMRTIKQRIYGVALWPLAILAVALVLINGFSRIEDADQAMRSAQQTTAALLQSPAVDALVLGNVLGFEQATRRVLKTTPSLVCVTLVNARQRELSKAGRCGRDDKLVYFPVTSSSKDLSDFPDAEPNESINGQLGLSMDIESLVRKRRLVTLQLALSMMLIGGVIGLTSQLLRVRLIRPIQRIAAAMQAVSGRDYAVRVPVEGDDELSRLAQAMNATTVALERHRDDADQALQDADDANLALGGLVLSITESLEGPMGRVHAELIEIAIANKDPVLKERIKAVIGSLQEVQGDLSDLIEIGSSAQGAKPAPTRNLDDIMSDIRRDVTLSAEAEGVPVHLSVTFHPEWEAQRAVGVGILLDIDGARLREVLLYLIRAMARRCTKAGVNVHAQILKVSDDQLFVSLHVTAFYDESAQSPTLQWLDGRDHTRSILRSVGLSDREQMIVEYLLRNVGIVPIVSHSTTGPVSIIMERACHYVLEQPGAEGSNGRRFSRSIISAVLVSNDTSLTRLGSRGAMTNVEIKLLSFSDALGDLSVLNREQAVLIDLSADIGEAHSFLDDLQAAQVTVPMIAICPAGRMSDVLSNRLIDLGFVGMLQKPLYYSRVIEVIRTTLSPSLKVLSGRRQQDQLGDA